VPQYKNKNLKTTDIHVSTYIYIRHTHIHTGKISFLARERENLLTEPMILAIIGSVGGLPLLSSPLLSSHSLVSAPDLDIHWESYDSSDS